MFITIPEKDTKEYKLYMLLSQRKEKRHQAPLHAKPGDDPNPFRYIRCCAGFMPWESLWFHSCSWGFSGDITVKNRWAVILLKRPFWNSGAGLHSNISHTFVCVMTYGLIEKMQDLYARTYKGISWARLKLYQQRRRITQWLHIAYVRWESGKHSHLPVCGQLTCSKWSFKEYKLVQI